MFGFIKKSLNKTIDAIKSVAPKKKIKIDKDDLETILIECDVSYNLIENILDGLPKEVTRDKIEAKLKSCFDDIKEFEPLNTKPNTTLIIGVNGAGKTTTIAKLAYKLKNEGKSVLLGAGDTFRAAAIEQLSSWASKIDVPIIKSKHGQDPSSIVYDAIASAKSKNVDEALIDTAGRLHNKVNLANELKKIVKVSIKALKDTPKKIIIIDGTQGNSALTQAKAFHEMVEVDAIIVTKLDGSAKGGAMFSIANELKLPIIYIGVGEGMEDLAPFDSDEFISSLLDEIYTKEESVEQDNI